MLALPLTYSDRSQLGGWLRREKDYLLTIQSTCLRIVTPNVTGATDCISNDLDFVNRLKSAIRDQDGPVMLSEDDAETLLSVGHANRVVDKAAFWESIVRKIQEVQHAQGHAQGC